MKKSLILALVAVFFACSARAGEVTPDMAKAVANAWVARNAAFGVSAAEVGAAVHFADTNGVTLWYQVQMGTSCLIVSPVTELEPVIAALENVDAEEGLPAGHPMLAMLTRDMTDRLKKLGLYPPQAPSGGATLLGAAPMSGTTPEDPEFAAAWAQEGEARWARLLPKGGFQLMAASKEEGVTEIDVQVGIVDGFEQGGRFTHWNQGNAGGGPCFNYYTMNNAVCGCVATSMGALMQFFAVAGCEAGVTCPAGLVRETQDSVVGARYVGADGNVTAGFTTIGGDYDWSLFADNTNRASYDTLTEEQRELLGRVAYDCGVAVAMEWTSTPAGSSAYVLDVAAALRKVFGFAGACAVLNPTEEQYAKLIYYQCWAGAPVQLGIRGAGGGHSVLAVGYGTDDGGIPRVRVFTGWGGKGDGWYALPYITTASVPGGSPYNFDVVEQVVTMIGYEDAKVIPVCGRIIPKWGDTVENATVECCGETVEANEKGFFGLRISEAEAAGLKTVLVEANGIEKTGSVVLGPRASPTQRARFQFNASDICSWVPDDIEIRLINSETASTFAEAKEEALASLDTAHPKAILAVSGTWSTNLTSSAEQATAAAWNYLLSLDEANTDDFTNKYVILCTPYGKSVSDGNPSIAVFDPRGITTDPDRLWSFYNGRHSYWSIGSAVYTDDAELAASAATNVVENGALTTYVTGEDITNAVNSVLEIGRTAFLGGVSGITLDVVGLGGEPGAVEPAYGLHENTISNGATMVVVPPDGTDVDTNGVTIVATAPAYATNGTQNIEFRCVGWLLSSTNSPEVLVNPTDVIPLVPNGAYTLTWLWEPNAVKIDVRVIENDSYGSVSPGSGWFPYGEKVTFTATPSDPKLTTYYHFLDWVQEDNQEGDDFVEAFNKYTFTAVRPLTVTARFGTAKTPQEIPPDPEEPATDTFDIVWNDDLSNLSVGYATNLLSASALQENGWTVDDLSVSAPTGWIATVSADGGGNAVATLSLDEAALESSMGTCSLTVVPNADNTLTVTATIANGLRGFWYVLYGSDDLATWEAVAEGTYESGSSAAQAQGTAENPVSEVELSIIVTPGDSGAGSKRFYKVVSGATSDPLAE